MKQTIKLLEAVYSTLLFLEMNLPMTRRDGALGYLSEKIIKENLSGNS